ncbi:hypothetical protein LSAT2_005809 [Lamellibrachia satsuma]|nr:hypothetical protein LSAT2_005809 [Lamellibrachia satsuma]
MIHEVNLGGGDNIRDPDVQLIDKVEEAQLEGKVQLVPNPESRATVSVSKHGIKIVDKQNHVLQRHPLHTLAQIVYYVDSFFKSNLALKIGQVGRSVYDCYVFQCDSEDQANCICQSLKDVYDIITQRNL